MASWKMTILEISVWALTRFPIMWTQRLPCPLPVTMEKRRSSSSNVWPHIILSICFQPYLHYSGIFAQVQKFDNSFCSILLFLSADQYYVYEFLHQPSHEECVTMSERSPSTLFRHYTDVYYNNYERFFSELFSDSKSSSYRLRL